MLSTLPSEILIGRHPGVEHGKGEAARCLQSSRKEACVSDSLAEGYEQVLETQILTYASLHRLLIAIPMRKNQRQRQWTLTVFQLLRVRSEERRVGKECRSRW